MNNRSNSKGHGKRTTIRDKTKETETQTKTKAKTTIKMTTPQLLNRNTRNMPAWVVREREREI